MPIATLEVLDVGVRVAYEDQANPRSEGEVIAREASQYLVRFDAGPRAGEEAWTDCRQAGWALLDLTGTEIIYAYSRAQAIEDGVLVALDAATLGEDMVAQAGWKYPAAMTQAMWASYVEVPEGRPDQDVKGRLWDILFMSSTAARALTAAGKSGDTVRFAWHCVTANGRRLIHGKVLVGPGDTPEPVLTFMLPDED